MRATMPACGHGKKSAPQSGWAKSWSSSGFFALSLSSWVSEIAPRVSRGGWIYLQLADRAGCVYWKRRAYWSGNSRIYWKGKQSFIRVNRSRYNDPTSASAMSEVVISRVKWRLPVPTEFSLLGSPISQIPWRKFPALLCRESCR